jgi:acyl-CoA thioester hydrolase
MSFEFIPEDKVLIASVSIPVRFSEVDSMGIVWHGNYLQYLEIAREQFGRQHNLGYLDIYAMGYQVPLIDLNIQYKWKLQYGDTVIVNATYKYVEGAKIVFDYKMTLVDSERVIATATTTQVFLDKEGNLMLIKPTFYEEWQRKNGFIS